jgi:hypothetical protein
MPYMLKRSLKEREVRFWETRFVPSSAPPAAFPRHLSERPLTARRSAVSAGLIANRKGCYRQEWSTRPTRGDFAARIVSVGLIGVLPTAARISTGGWHRNQSAFPID